MIKHIIFALVVVVYGNLNVQAQSSYIDSSISTDSLNQTISQIEIIKQSGNNFPITDLESEKVGFLVPSDFREWERLVYRYINAPIYNSKDQRYPELIEKDSIEHLVIVLDSMSGFSVDDYESEIKISLLVYTDSINKELMQAIDAAENVLHCKKNSSIARDLSVQFLFNAIQRQNNELYFDKSNRLNYLPARTIGLNDADLKMKVDSVVHQAILAGAFPGCRVLVAIKGTVIFNEAYGYHTYHKRKLVRQHDVYDLASVTKISGPLPLIMKACDEGLMELDKPFHIYWPDWDRRLFHRSNKDGMSLRQVLAHQARLTPYINYYPLLKKNDELNSKYFHINSSEKYSLKIDHNLYLSASFKKEVYKLIRKSPLLDDAKYKYSGLSYMIYPELLSELFHEDFEQHLYQDFFKPLGASSLCYNPLGKLETSRIVPTEYDVHFRNKQIRGLVHDEAAAVMGGISGNAGLFSSADDLAKLMQMYLQKGEYAGKRYISVNTLDEFTKVQYPDNENRRGAGFDKPLFGNDTLSIKDSYPAPAVSSSSFGHSGFTGTFVWVDPEYDLVYIFLSNRVYPRRDNRLIYQMNVRPSIQQIFYDAIKERDDYQSSGSS
ncbi:serine hydrolase domain-containing protein [Carboxylicivirga marina]|uniref:Serine hydrolase n=1 Tax=Carboxylicivirga marina TaxID=2800988 RepID=A0ABS1HGJ0_9BACT|nr:serine hydrolase [Carboxylicivirga marina]MBK3516790.1 serine hydrolase [Carboxylicivirga marina]